MFTNDRIIPIFIYLVSLKKNLHHAILYLCSLLLRSEMRHMTPCNVKSLKWHLLRFISGKYCLKVEKGFDLSLNMYKY